MNGGIIELITVFVLAAFVGFEVISKVPSILHTPLMSGTNAIHGVILVGAMVVLGTGHGPLELTLGFLAVVLATVNVIGGFVVTDRMLEFFKSRDSPGSARTSTRSAETGRARASRRSSPSSGVSSEVGTTSELGVGGPAPSIAPAPPKDTPPSPGSDSGSGSGPGQVL